VLRRRHTVLLQRWLQKLACSQASIQAYWRWRSVEFQLGQSPCLAMRKPNSQVPRCKRARSPRRASRAGGKRHLQRHSSGELPSRGSKKPRLPPARLARRARVQDSQQGAGSPAVLLQIGRHGTGVHGCRYTACMEIRAFPIIKRICLQYRVSGNKGPLNIYR
jgi:hypothetical protein